AIDIVKKTMKIDDDLMWRWIELLSFKISVAEAVVLRDAVAKSELNPRDVKLRLAHELVSRFHDDAAAEQAIAGWHMVMNGAGNSSLLPLHEVNVSADGLRIVALLTKSGLTTSNSEAVRKLKERAVRVDGVVVEDAHLHFMAGFEGVIQIGKRNFIRIRLVN
ncbi:MAG TPA: tyrosine--tRNA ligase, partial [Xylella sp.]